MVFGIKTKKRRVTKPAGKTAETATPGFHVERRFTTKGENPLDQIKYTKRSSVISNPDGSVVFKMDEVTVPEGWSQLATDIIVSKYFRKRGVPKTGHEVSAREVVYRITNTIRQAGEELGGYFLSTEDADAFEAELAYILINQYGAFNSPVWFNCGLYHQYGITGSGGNWYWDPEKDEFAVTADSYSHPQSSACFIQSVDDDLMSIFGLAKSEAKLFKFGSGTGTNFSKLRGKQERLSGGGTSSGLMSFLEVLDRGAGATKSGGTTRRAAKMACLDIDHPEIADFVNWKVNEEKKVAALIAAGYSSDFNGEAYKTVSGQNSNNSVRVSADFMHAYLNNKEWNTTFRTTGEVCDTYRATDLMKQIAHATWVCADPGMQFDTTINRWHTCKESGRINASNPCFPGDAKVYTDKGLIDFSEIIDRVNSGETFKIYTNNVTSKTPSKGVSLSDPSQFMITGINDIYLLKFSNGLALRCTENHRIFTSTRGMIETKNLTPEDEIFVNDCPLLPENRDSSFGCSIDWQDYRKKGERYQAINLPLCWDEDFAEILGHLIGDGTVGETMLVWTYGSKEDKEELLPKHKKYLENIVGKGSVNYSIMANGVEQLRVVRAPFRHFLEKLGVKRAKAAHKEVPESVFQTPAPIMAAFLRGLFNADGCAYEGKNATRYVGLGSKSLQLLQDVQKLLLVFGIHSNIYSCARDQESTKFHYTRKDGTTVEYTSPGLSYDLRISANSIKSFYKFIGFSVSNKKNKLEDWVTGKEFYNTKNTVSLVSMEYDSTEVTYNLTEPLNHSYIVDGIVVGNCAEFMFLDNSSCNLASINLMKLYNAGAGEFDAEAFKHVCKMFILAQEILVDFSSYPTEPITRSSHDFRPLGLGYANMGTLLMVNGLPYDSDEGRELCSAITATMTGHAYTVSSEIAQVKGAFPAYARNRQSMLEVIKMHREAAYQIDQEKCPRYLIDAARLAWDSALAGGAKYGFRNAQATVLAPTGTIGLLMDCDTTGIEPDYSLVKFKKLAGGGYFKIVNQSIPVALRKLRYTETQINEIITYISGTSSLKDAPFINRETLKSKGFTKEDMDKVEKTLPGVFNLSLAFNSVVLGEKTLQRFGLTPDKYTQPDFNLLDALGFSEEEIEDAGVHICGKMTIEGAPHIKDEHLPVFDCANRCGKYGQRFLAPIAHIKMMSAAQKFISGAISKTINLPNQITEEEIERLYIESWREGLKAVAFYRDGSKHAQPLNAIADQKKKLDFKRQSATSTADQVPIAATPVLKRRRLPKKRHGFTIEARVGGQKVYLRTGEYNDCTLGEIFIDMHKEGAAFRSMMNCFAIAISLGLQYGVPLDEYINCFTFTRFEPSGTADHPNIKMATSPIDFIFRVLGMEYLGMTDFVQVKPNEEDLAVNLRAQMKELKKKLTEKKTEPKAEAGEMPDPAVPKTFLADHVRPEAPAKERAETTDVPHIVVTKRTDTSGAMDGLQTKITSSGAVVRLGSAAKKESTTSASQYLSTMMGDAPFCDQCGHLTMRNGSCYRCLNCGNSMGCS